MSPVWLAVLRLSYAIVVLGGALAIALRFPSHSDAAIVMAFSALASLVSEIRNERQPGRDTGMQPAVGLVEETRTRRYNTPRGVPTVDDEEPTAVDIRPRRNDGGDIVLMVLCALGLFVLATTIGYHLGLWVATRGIR